MNHKDAPHQRSHYGRLLLMIAISFVAMYGLMYAMVNRFENVHANVNQAYMAGLMAAVMLPIELLVMRSMYHDRRRNLLYIAAGIIVVVACWVGIRHQIGVGDVQFVRSMIPHHAGAILMCGKAKVSDAEVRKLCGDIISSQEREIDQMNAILRRLDAR